LSFIALKKCTRIIYIARSRVVIVVIVVVVVVVVVVVFPINSVWKNGHDGT
jgi:uncharacterized membrane protein affecting hemolysin expression